MSIHVLAEGNYWDTACETWETGDKFAGIYMSANCSECLKNPVDDWADERADVLNRFTEELAKATGDGSKKRQAGTKPPWYEDDAHEAAIFSHLAKWKRGDTIDPDSGAHTLVHAAWRCLAIACQESGNTPSFPSI